MPNIIKETCNGILLYSIQDFMLTKREIECMGEINSQSVNSLIRQIRYLEAENENEEITMFINSPGGEITSGLALYDVMKAVKCPIHTVCTGMAASMAAILFSAGDKRHILEHARVMIHDPQLIQGYGGSTLTVKAVAEDMMRIREITCKILADHTGKSLEEIYDKTAKDTYFNAEEAVEYGLADKIIHKI